MYSKKAKAVSEDASSESKASGNGVDATSNSISLQPSSRKRYRSESSDTSQVVGLNISLCTRSEQSIPVFESTLVSSRKWVCADHTLSSTSSARPSAVWLENPINILSTLPVHPVYNPGTSNIPSILVVLLC
jgi:hypothetical protein